MAGNGSVQERGKVPARREHREETSYAIHVKGELKEERNIWRERKRNPARVPHISEKERTPMKRKGGERVRFSLILREEERWKWKGEIWDDRAG